MFLCIWYLFDQFQPECSKSTCSFMRDFTVISDSILGGGGGGYKTLFLTINF